ncbi:alanine--tRNA ligase [Lactococcus fujiensis]|uniref:Alanine--tRNA ligase n=1 Tax=Lactococcus fujiensis JCM 16395 TaxID=1291764 RepID=A0A2A5RPG8_9LACT|nr:alanine--tRNA ligase [Lactococcus fujiensis]PCS01324.1 alanyl-tRNA synthase [Lactococcus fujiensis JCM 16395]
MKYMTSSEIRDTFLKFFESKGSAIMPSQSLVPVNDPTLLWINSGVATMKKYFDGSVVPENPRMTSSQKSIRTNDIENVGKTARHHTMFEMMGNFSIGDYFRTEAIAYAFELLTDEKYYGFPVEKLFVTYYPDDKDTYNRWIEVGLPESHLVPIEDNFWEIGAGPSGPDTEIFFDRGEKYDPEHVGLRLLAEDIENDRYIEIYNVVLSQFNADPSIPRKEYKELPQKNIDTGMGLERMTCIIQGGRTNFDTDLFLPIIHEIEKLSGKTYDPDGENMSFKVIADHIRSLSFAIGDGALPGNEGRGYVLRRLLRRAVMHGKRLGIQSKFLAGLVPIVGKVMEDFYPEVLEKADFIEKIIDREEETFNRTIDAGQKLIDELLVQLKDEGKDTLDGEDIFRLYDTYGFPVELTEELAEDEGFKIDHAGFDAAMKEQQDRARAAVVKGGSMGAQNETLSSIEVESTFLYETHTADGKLEVIVSEDKKVEKVSNGTAQLVFDQTPFYAEMGGQVADHGFVKNKEGDVVAEVTDVQHAPHGQNLHTVNVLVPLKVGQTYHLEIDEVRRNAVVKNHTATHLLHAALHNIVGEHALQAGSLNETDFLRFDFTHYAQVTKEELAEIEQEVNEVIWQNIAVKTIETDVETAKAMGAAALFGDKYGKVVRAVVIGDYSVELCGGTHTSTTSEIGLFKIVKEEGIGSGVRRITALTGQKAYEAFKNAENTLTEVATIVKAPQTNQVIAKVTSLTDELKVAQKDNEALAGKLAASQSDEIFKNVQESGKYSYIAREVKVPDVNGLRNLADIWKQKELSDVLVLIARIGEKVNLLVASKNSDLKAGNVVKELAPYIDGRGGGKPDLAMAGGSNAEGIQTLLAHVGEKLV